MVKTLKDWKKKDKREKSLDKLLEREELNTSSITKNFCDGECYETPGCYDMPGGCYESPP
jgi:hypothetical protein